jgi:pimeloyl-ACP methyl ester carboxylesterase
MKRKEGDMKIKLLDGRELAYAEYGDPRGTPVFLFHGAPGSRLFHPPDDITKRLGVRLICVDRPGYGGSTFQPNRCILDWPKDVAALADSLNLDRFAVAGHSGGGPHTLACAYALPERVTAAAVLSGAGPVDAPGATEGMTLLNKFGFTFGQYIPWPVWRALIWFFFREQAANPAAIVDNDKGKRALADDEVFNIPGVREVCIQSDVEAYRQGLLGFAWEVRLITRPWGFPLEEIKVPVYLWHGTADDVTSVRMGRLMASRIPNCKATFCEGEAHMLLIPHWEEILTALTRTSI